MIPVLPSPASAFLPVLWGCQPSTPQLSVSTMASHLSRRYVPIHESCTYGSLVSGPCHCLPQPLPRLLLPKDAEIQTSSFQPSSPLSTRRQAGSQTNGEWQWQREGGMTTISVFCAFSREQSAKSGGVESV